MTSAGPDGRFSTAESYSRDDFRVDSIGIDYFADTRTQADRALAQYFKETQTMPENLDQLRVALQKAGMNWDEMKDPWGHSYYAQFRQESRYSDEIIIENYQQRLGTAVQRTTTTPVTKTVNWVYIRSAGEDGEEGTRDDFDSASYSRSVLKQSGQDATPVPTNDPTILMGASGVITGVVMDADGKAIVGARVTAKSNVTGEIFQATSDDRGVYVLRNLPVGHYVVSVLMANFRTTVITNVPVAPWNTTVVDARLEVGTMNVQVAVESGQQLLETVSTSSVMVSAKPRIPQLAEPPQISTPRLRQYFPETLYWQPELVTDAKGRAQIKFPLADNITTWKLSAIASTENGEIGTVEKEIRAFQPFFVEHDPPRFLTDGDEISLPVVLRNYLSRSLQINVVMKPESWFAPLSPVTVKSNVSAGDTASEVFKFRATAPIRDGKQRVTATDGKAGAGDAIERTVTVRPNGEERTETVSQIVNDGAAFDLHIPANALAGSLDGKLKIYPNLNAHVLESIEAILERPYGCAEQSISSTYPSVLLLNYLKSTGKENSAVASKARRYVQLGYARLLSYRASDGGFTYWGKGEADLALSAYAVKFLNDASAFIDVDDAIVNDGVTWLLKQAQPDGRWMARNWNGDENPQRTAILTAYIAKIVSSVKLTDVKSSPKRQLEVAASTAVNRALDYLWPKTLEMDEPYLIASFALAIPIVEENSRFADSLTRLRKLEHREGDASYWTLEMNTPFYGWGLAGRIETTALALQALKKGDAGASGAEDRDMLSRGLLFLLKNQDRYGIWYSSQATINVLNAIEKLTTSEDRTQVAADTSARTSKAEIMLDGRSILSVDVPSSNEVAAPVVVDISKFLTAGNHHLEIRRAAGSTPASVQAVSAYYVPWAETASDAGRLHEMNSSEALRLEVHFNKVSAKAGETVECAVNAERIGFRGYGMMLAEIGLPPGAEVDRASLERAMAEAGWGIDQYDVLPDRLVVYLWPHAGGTKFTFTFKPRFGVNALSAPSILYDYYNPEARAVVKPVRFVVQ